MTTQHLKDSLYTGVRIVKHSLPYQSWFEGHILAWHETEREAWDRIEREKKVGSFKGLRPLKEGE